MYISLSVVKFSQPELSVFWAVRPAPPPRSLMNHVLAICDQSGFQTIPHRRPAATNPQKLQILLDYILIYTIFTVYNTV